MKRQLNVSPQADQDLTEISEYIGARNPIAAKRFLKSLKKTFETLAVMPGLGAAWESTTVPDLRFWPLTRYRNYVVFYRPIANGVEILRVVHGAQDYPRLLEDLH